MKIALLGNKGGSGRSTSALILAHGLSLMEREATLVECVAPGRTPGLAPDQSPPFKYLPVAVDEPLSGALLAERIGSVETGGDVVLDPPPLGPEEAVKLVRAVDLVLLPLHPDPADLATTRHFLEALDRLEPGWKAVPPRWIIHIDPIQSLRGSLTLVDALVKGWQSESMPPLVIPWTLPHLGRPELRALGTGAPVGRTLAATCRILAITAIEIAASPQELLLPRMLEARLPDELKDRFHGEARSLAEKLGGLAFDVAAIRGGEGPRPTDLLGAPVLDDWSQEPFQATLLAGSARGHPRLGSNRVRTTMAVIVDENEGWARTLSRYYRLGQKAKRNPPGDGQSGHESSGRGPADLG
jgi:hypothetical protein